MLVLIITTQYIKAVEDKAWYLLYNTNISNKYISRKSEEIIQLVFFF